MVPACYGALGEKDNQRKPHDWVDECKPDTFTVHELLLAMGGRLSFPGVLALRFGLSFRVLLRLVLHLEDFEEQHLIL